MLMSHLEIFKLSPMTFLCPQLLFAIPAKPNLTTGANFIEFTKLQYKIYYNIYLSSHVTLSTLLAHCATIYYCEYEHHIVGV